MGWYCLFHYFLLLLLVLLVHFISFTCSTTLPDCNPHDSHALLHFKDSIVVNTSIADYWSLQFCEPLPLPSKIESWESGTNCCHWDGVTCDAVSGRVIGLDLSCSHLQGKLHPNTTLFHLTHLQHLNLAFNDFSASFLPPGIGDLVSLTHLNLAYSSFMGDIPTTISHLSKLVSLDLSNDYLSCNLFFSKDYLDCNSSLRLDPSTWNRFILNATNLEELVLYGVNMSSIREDSLSLLMNLSSSLVSLHMDGTYLQCNFPIGILSLPNLQELTLSINRGVEGELPKSNWSAPLRLLDLSSTSFPGEIPNSIGHLKSLNQLWVSDCQLEGLVPLSLWNLSQLTDLDLADNGLIGEIPSLLSNLKHLTSIYLEFNNFSGQIPDVFGNLTMLEYLALSYNKLGGQLPSSLFSLTQLTHLDLSVNNLEGPIPSTFGSASKLEQLLLENNLLNGTIPHWCYSLPSLLELYLSDNKLKGSIDEFSAYSLTSLQLSNNNFQGKFPKSIFEFENLTDLGLSSNNLMDLVDFHQFSRLKKLQVLDLSHNFISCDIDDNFDNILPNLNSLYLSSCNITKFPPFIARLQYLTELDLSNNKIHEKIPRWFNDNLLYSWKKIIFIDLSFNKLTGAISSALCNASSLTMLILSHNNLISKIPQCLGSFSSLQVLDLQRNNLNGSIPRNFSKSNAFETLKLNDNLLEGPLPQSLGHCTNLEVLDLGDNYIQDSFPSWLETLPKLKVLVLRANMFHGIITSFNTKHPFPNLRIFDVSNNKISGALPTTYFKNFQEMMIVNSSQSGLEYIGNITYRTRYKDSVVVTMKGQFRELERILTVFTTIDLSNNKFEGEIPQVIGELKSLKGLNLSHNAIRGTIPDSLGNLTNLEWLDISSNQLEGEIPMALTDLNFLSFLNLSQNQLQGTIPAGKQFNTFQNDSYLGNPMLCGSPLSKSCNHDEEKPASTSVHEEERLGFGWKPVAVGYACGVVFGMVLRYCFFLTGKPLWLTRLIGLPNKRANRANNRARANR